MLDENQIGRDYWDRIKREKETARKLNELNFNYNLYDNYDYWLQKSRWDPQRSRKA